MSAAAISSGILATGVTTIFTGVSLISSIQGISDGTNPATVTVYDNTTNSGKVLAVVKVLPADPSKIYTFCSRLRADIGVTVEVTGTGAQAVIGYGA